jgi:GNAT superfamily N-acetyltransferase
MTIIIRTFTNSEWQLYRDLRLRALLDSPDAFGSTHAGSVEYPDRKWQKRLAGVNPHFDLPLLAEVEGQAVGLAWGRSEAGDEITATLNQMWTAPEVRGQGIGRQLLITVIDWSRDNGFQQLLLEVTQGNNAARLFYESAGFTPTGQLEPLRPGSDLVVQSMCLQL